MVFSQGNLPGLAKVTQMTSNAFGYFGVPALLWRVFTRADAPPGKSPAPVAVISYLFWKRHYASQRSAVGKTIRLDDQPYTIIGVLPHRFTWRDGDVYLPLDLNRKDISWLAVGARLRPGVTLGRATADVQLIFGRLAKLYPGDYPRNGFTIKVEGLNDWYIGSFRETLLLLVAAAGLLLLIACSNVANLQLARASGRETETAVRASVGAGRGRIIRQLLTESVIISLVGGALGILLAYAGVRLIVAIMPPYAIPHEAVLGVNGMALLFTVVLSVVVGGVFGLIPALRLAKFNLTESLSQGGRGGADSISRDRTCKTLIVAEYAIALVLLASAGLTVRSFIALRDVGSGFDPSHVMIMGIPMQSGRYSRWSQRITFLNNILSRVKALPGVGAAALDFTGAPPFGGANTSVEIENAPAQENRAVEMNLVSAGFF